MTQPADPRLLDDPELAQFADAPDHLLERLIDRLDRDGPPRALLDALLLHARIDLGLPAVAPRTLADLPEPLRTRYEDRYVEAIRRVGTRLLAAGEIAGAWPYFRILGEKQPIADALESVETAADDPNLSNLVDVAFNQGAHPAWGFRRILEHYGLCSAITAFEHLPPEEAVRSQAAEQLTRALHDQLTFSLRAELQRRGEPLTTDPSSIAELIDDRPGLFDDEAYHVDTSHLASIARMAYLLRDPASLGLARDLATYGQRLSVRYKYAAEPPFADLYGSTGRYLDALLGRDVDGSIEHFAAQLTTAEAANSVTAQVLVRLLDRLGRAEEAMEVAIGHLAGVPDGHLACPTIAELCLKAGRPDRLAEFALGQGDTVLHAAALLTPRPAKPRAD